MTIFIWIEKKICTGQNSSDQGASDLQSSRPDLTLGFNVLLYLRLGDSSHRVVQERTDMRVNGPWQLTLTALLVITELCAYEKNTTGQVMLRVEKDARVPDLTILTNYTRGQTG